MRAQTLLVRSLLHYWRSNVAVVLGVAAAAAVLGGSLVVGDSVRGSLAATALERLGRTTHTVESTGFFRADLAAELASLPSFSEGFDAACPIVAVRGVATHATSQRRAGDVQVYGVDERFWNFHDRPVPELGRRDALLSEALAAELGAETDEAVLVRFDAASEIPGSSLFGRRDEAARALRVTVTGVLSPGDLGEFLLRPRAGRVRAVFVPLRTLERALGLEDRANVLLVSAKTREASVDALETALGEAIALEDLGVRVRGVPQAGAVQLDTTSALVDGSLQKAATTAAKNLGLRVGEVFVYLANTIRVGEREVPYSLVAALDPASLEAVAGVEVTSADGEPPPIVLNEWVAMDLGAVPGSRVTLEYFLWHEDGRMETGSTPFSLAAVTPLEGRAADPDLVPEYPGITESLRLADWDPPFPVDLDRIRQKDEDYWDDHRATPKAFVPLAVGQRLWGHRLGGLTGMRLVPETAADLGETRGLFAAALLAELGRRGAPPGFAVVPVRQAALAAARGSIDFGEYFAYFSFFLVVAALLLAGLFFRLGLEGRLRELGLLGALGYPSSRVRRLFLAEGALLSGLGGLIGAFAAAGYAALVLWGLRSLWAEGLGTRDLDLHLGVASPLLGAVGAGLAALLSVVWTLRSVQRLPPRMLLAGTLEPWVKPTPARRRRKLLPAGLTLVALLLVAASGAGAVPQTAGFFGAGGLLLAAALLYAGRLVAGRPSAAAAVTSVLGLGLRGVSFRPGRSVLCIALVASATFVIVAVGSFRREGADIEARDGESGGYRLQAWSVAPLHHDLTSAEGRAALALEGVALEGIDVGRFRARVGEDASCLNLYQPRVPTVIAASPSFIEERRFSFAASLAESPEEHDNPWRLLEREVDSEGAIPVIVDASALTYVLHQSLGDVMSLGETGVRVRFVGTLAPGLLQGELITSERHFLQAFPGEAGYRFFLFDVDAERAPALSQDLESHLSDFGFDVTETAERLRDLHRVENTYIATFQALGALGLLLGTVGLAAVLMRNALEQRGALALLRAVGYRRAHMTRMVLAENVVLVGLGFLAGAVPALVAIAPVLLERRGAVPLALLASLLVAIVVTGALVSWLAVSYIRRLPLVESLHAVSE